MDHEITENSTWRSLRMYLREKNTPIYELDDVWYEAFELFQKRLDNKFFNPIAKIIREKQLKGEGFAIVTVQCALIESLASFKEGKIFVYPKPRTPAHYEYWESGKMFIKFLHDEEIFKDNFWCMEKGLKVKDKPFSATEFYKNIRCGLMHEARTKSDWTINATKKKVKTETVFLENRKSKKAVLRSVLHYRLKEYVKQYVLELSNPQNVDLRKNFARKLDNLYDLPRDNGFDWWRS